MPFTSFTVSRAAAALLLAIAAVVVGSTATASAAPVSYTNNGAIVTLDSNTYAQGTRITIEGTNFAPQGGLGNPLVAVQPNDSNEHAWVQRWTAGGPSARPNMEFDNGLLLIFEVDTAGKFSGWVDIPWDLTLAGPGVNQYAGNHWLRFLCGVLSTGSNVCTPTTIPAYFAVTQGTGIPPGGVAPPPPPPPPPPPGGVTPGGVTPGGVTPGGTTTPTTKAIAPRTTTGKLTSKGQKLQLKLGSVTKAQRAAITVKSAAKVRLGSRKSAAKTLTITRPLTVSMVAGAKSKTVNLTLSADGKKALKRFKRLRVVVRIAPVGGGTATTKTLTLKA